MLLLERIYPRANIKQFPAYKKNFPNVWLERTVRAGDGGAAGETRHSVAGHGQRVWLRVGADPHAGEGGGHRRHARVRRQTPVPRLEPDVINTNVTCDYSLLTWL